MVNMRKDGTPVWKAKEESQKKYDSANTLRFGLKLNMKTDADIIEAFENVPSRQGFIKEAIRFYLAHKDEEIGGRHEIVRPSI